MDGRRTRAVCGKSLREKKKKGKNEAKEGEVEGGGLRPARKMVGGQKGGRSDR
jgi:hypothetical protein